MRHIEGHTSQAFDGELGQLHLLLVEMGGLVWSQLNQALQGLQHFDKEIAIAVIARDNDVDDLEIRVDAEIESILARRTPVARDLRTVLACSKSVAALEQIGDEAEKIARVTLQLSKANHQQPNQTLVYDTLRLGQTSLQEFSSAMQALDVLDSESANKLIRRAKKTDEELQLAFRRIATFLIDNTQTISQSIRFLLVAKGLERVALLSRNIAEHIIYLVEGDDIRHPRAQQQKTFHN